MWFKLLGRLTESESHLESYTHGINVYIRVCTAYMICMYYAIVCTYHIRRTDTFIHFLKFMNTYIHFGIFINMYVHGMYTFINIQV